MENLYRARYSVNGENIAIYGYLSIYILLLLSTRLIICSERVIKYLDEFFILRLLFSVLYIRLIADMRAFLYSSKRVLVLCIYPLYLVLLATFYPQLLDPFLFSSAMLLRKNDNILSISLSKALYLKSVDDISSCIPLDNDNIFINVIY